MDRWVQSFSDLFDSLFGKRHLTWRCFYRSCVASTVVAILTWIFIILTGNSAFVLGARFAVRHISHLDAATIWFLGAMLLFVNYIPDYVSLLETRFLLSIAHSIKTYKGMTCLLLIDLCLTAAMSAGPALLGYFTIMQGVQTSLVAISENGIKASDGEYDAWRKKTGSILLEAPGRMFSPSAVEGVLHIVDVRRKEGTSI